MSFFSAQIDPQTRWQGKREQVKRIVVCRHDHLGDLVLSAPFLRALRSGFRQAEIVAVVRPGLEDVLSDCPYVDRVLAHRYDDMAVHRANVSQLRRSGVDIAVALAPQSLDYKLCYQVQAPVRVGVVRHERFLRLFMSRFWLTHILREGEKKTAQRGGHIDHEVVRTFRLADFLGCGVSLQSAEPGVAEEQRQMALEAFLNAENRQYGERLQQIWGKPRWAIHLHGRWLRDKRDTEESTWTLEQVLELWERLPGLDGEGRVLFTYGSGERSLAEEVAQALAQRWQCRPFWLDGRRELPERIGERVVLAGNLPYQRWAAVLGSASCVLTPDTGAVHVAAAMQVPVIDIFPPKYADWSAQAFSPWQVPSSVIVKGSYQKTSEDILAAARHLCPVGDGV